MKTTKEIISKVESLLENKKFKEQLLNLLKEHTEEHCQSTASTIVSTTTPYKTLNEEQTIIFNRIKDFIESPTKEVARLTGAAGTGKTHLIKVLLEYLTEIKYSWCVACPTNKAAKNIMKQIPNGESKIYTIASLLGQKPELNPETGEEEFNYLSVNNDKFKDLKILILDEYSMVTEVQWLELTKQREELNIKILAVGDDKQLPPIEDSKSGISVVAICDVDEDLRLTEVVRYTGDLLRIADTIRKEGITSEHSWQTSKDNSIRVIPYAGWLMELQSIMRSEDFANDPNTARALAWRNVTIDQINSQIRGYRWGHEVAKQNEYHPGELLTLRKPVIRLKDLQRGYEVTNEIVIATNSTEYILIKSPKLKEDLKYHLKYWKLTVEEVNGKKCPTPLRVLAKEDVKTHRQLTSDAFKKAKIDKQYANAFYLSKFFDAVVYGYALTVHRAQGSTINNVFLDWKDISKNRKDLTRMTYTALTRASENVYISL
jgi:hypothetical protein